MHKFFIILFGIVMMFLLSGCGFVSDSLNDSPSNDSPYPSVLKVNGKNIQTDKGEQFYIKGIALTNGVYTESSISEARDISKGYADSGFLLKEEDYQNIRDMGLNSVRFYLQYNWLDNDSKIASFNEVLNEQIALASSHNIYIILSLHYFGTGSGGHFYDGRSGYDCVAFWQRIVSSYKDNKVILGYDLLNEPKVNTANNFTEADLYTFYNQLITAIRLSDDEHIIFISDPVNKYDDIEYYSKPETPVLPIYYNNSQAFQSVNDDNVVYQYHWYKPSEFTHQSFPYDTYFELGSSYPYFKYNEEYLWHPDYNGGWYDDKKMGSTSVSPNGWADFSGEWVELSVITKDSQTTHFGISLLFGNANGEIWIDQLRLKKRLKSNPELEINIPLKNEDFVYPTRYTDNNINKPSDMPANWTKSVHPDNDSDVIFSFDSDVAYSSGGSLYADTRTTGWVAGSYASWKSGEGRNNYLIPIEEGYEYQISFKVKYTGSVEAVSGGFEWYKVDPVVYDANYNRDSINSYYQSWADANIVPLYCGEFGVANPGQFLAGYPNSPEEQVQWINDMKDILTDLNHHWTYHDYKDFSDIGFGLFDHDNNIPLRQALSE